ncbi:MAG: hypothetical protein ACM3ZC_17075 [Bacteroidota bacterium]
MAKRHILRDKTELVCFVEGKKDFKVVNLTYEKIAGIRIEACKEFRWFRFVPSEMIVITVKGRNQPLVYKKAKEKKYFQEYKDLLAEFAREHWLSFRDLTIGGEAEA